MPSDAEVAADIAIAVEHGDRESLIIALLAHPEASGLERDVIEGTADMLLGD